MKKILVILSLVFFSSCTQRGCQSFQRGVQLSERKYSIEMYSGGKVVYYDQFTGIVNGEENSDGIYYFKQNDTLVEISGDYVIKSIK